MIRIRPLVATLAACLCLAAPARAQDQDLLIFAAASLREALEAVTADWPGDAPAISYAGTSALARQIEAGAPADIFISANADWMAHLAARDLIRPDLNQVLVTNRLVLAGPAGAVTPGPDLGAALAALPPDARIATGLLQAVPAGLYARQALDATGSLEATLPRIVQAENVRLALALVARREVARAITYRTDALAEPAVAIEVLIPADLHDPIRYPAAVTAHSRHPQAEAFFAHLTSGRAAAIFARFGFEVPQ